MSDKNTVPPLEVDKALFKDMPAEVQSLMKQGRKGQREKQRKQYITTHGNRSPNPSK